MCGTTCRLIIAKVYKIRDMCHLLPEKSKFGRGAGSLGKRKEEVCGQYFLYDMGVGVMSFCDVLSGVFPSGSAGFLFVMRFVVVAFAG